MEKREEDGNESENNVSSNDYEDTSDDENTCTEFQLDKCFEMKYEIGCEVALTLKENYVLKLCSDHTFTRLVAGLSNSSVYVCDVSQQKCLINFTPNSPTLLFNSDNFEGKIPGLCGVRFLDETPNTLLVGWSRGFIRLYDLRMQGEQICFEKPSLKYGYTPDFLCFDRNAISRILGVGTESIHGNSQLLFYDIRKRLPLGAYYESHNDDVTTIQFHEYNPDLVCTGSTDGLINIFNLEETCEEDAIMSVINTQSSVHKVNWHKNVDGTSFVSCITHTNDFQVHDAFEGCNVARFSRSDLTNVFKRKRVDNCNLINVHNINDESVFLLLGTNMNKGEILRSVLLQDKLLLPLANYEDNKQIIRESVFDAKSNYLVTGGESSFLTLWRPKMNDNLNNDACKLKVKTKLTSSFKKPY